eukprot:522476-Pyramimonas_sp.AAC.1
MSVYNLELPAPRGLTPATRPSPTSLTTPSRIASAASMSLARSPCLPTPRSADKAPRAEASVWPPAPRPR